MVTVMKAKSASSLRWAILVCASLLMLSNYYVYDVPASLYVASCLCICLYMSVCFVCVGGEIRGESGCVPRVICCTNV